MLKRDKKGQEWIASDVKVSKDKFPMKGATKIFVDDVYCGEYIDSNGDGVAKEVKC